MFALFNMQLEDLFSTYNVSVKCDLKTLDFTDHDLYIYTSMMDKQISASCKYTQPIAIIL